MRSGPRAKGVAEPVELFAVESPDEASRRTRKPRCSTRSRSSRRRAGCGAAFRRRSRQIAVRGRWPPPRRPAPAPATAGAWSPRLFSSRGVEHLFTLSGGHLFSIYDGCKEEGIEIVDVRHEQAAVWAAEGYAKATRKPGVAALTAGPGVTNGMSAIAGAFYNRSPDHRPRAAARPRCAGVPGRSRRSTTCRSSSRSSSRRRPSRTRPTIAARTAAAIDLSMAHPSGPTFLDFPLDTVFNAAESDPGA